MMFAAELATETSYHVIVDRSIKSFESRVTGLLAHVGDQDYDIASGAVDADEIDKAVKKIQAGDWDYSMKC